MRTHWMAGTAPKKAGDVETNPDPITTHKQVWIGDTCHKQIQDRKQISIRFNMIKHWVPQRCADIRLTQYRHTSHTPLFPQDWSKPILLSTQPSHLLHRPEPNTYTFFKLQLISSHAPHSSLARHLRKTHYLNHMYHLHTYNLHSSQPYPPPSPTPNIAVSHTLSQYTYIEHKTTGHVSQLPKSPHPHRVPRQSHSQTTYLHTPHKHTNPAVKVKKISL